MFSSCTGPEFSWAIDRGIGFVFRILGTISLIGGIVLFVLELIARNLDFPNVMLNPALIPLRRCICVLTYGFNWLAILLIIISGALFLVYEDYS